MSNQIDAPIIDLSERQALIRSFPCFKQLSDEQSLALAALTHDVCFVPGQVIVAEQALVDSIYFIVSGSALVTRGTKEGRHIHQEPIATLHAGEAIGLNDAGFYSGTGTRTATVHAQTSMVLLRLSLDDLEHFLQKYHLESAMSAAATQMLRVQFIKQTLPFTKLSHKRLQWLADHVEAMSLPAGSVIFKQGETGDRCYMICKGKVAIVTDEGEREPRRLALLGQPAIFGEATLLTQAPRNASAIVHEDCELLVLTHADFAEVIASETNVGHILMTMAIDRSRPLKSADVTTHQLTTADGAENVILKHTENGNYFKLSTEGMFIWQQLDGEHTLQDITLSLANKFNVFAPDLVAALIYKLAQSGFIANATDNTLPPTKPEEMNWATRLVMLRRLFEFRHAFGDADPWVTRTYQRYVRHLFSFPAQIILAVLAVSGFINFCIETPEILYFFGAHHASLFLLLTLIPISLVSVTLHELAHAYAVKALGREVHYIGVGWYWFLPMAFTDTSDMWLSPRKARMQVNIAGVYMDVLVAAVMALLISFVNNPYIQGVLWLVALNSYIAAVRMLSPLQELDGYYILMDWLEKPRLRQSSVLWLVNQFKVMRQPIALSKYNAEIIYWLACLVYLVVITLITLILQHFLLTIFDLKPNPYTSFIIPLVVIIFSCVSVLADIKSKAVE